MHSFLPSSDPSNKDVFREVQYIFFLGLLLAIPIGIFGAMPLNAPLLLAIPLPLAVIFFFLPLAVLYGYTINHVVSQFDKKLQKRLTTIRIIEDISYIARCKKNPENNTSLFELSSTDDYSWTSAIFFIEKISPTGTVEHEKHVLGSVGPFARIILKSKLSFEDGSRWKVMAISKEGGSVTIPERWKDFDFKKLK